jgi:cell division FtsZ-interacting protein ZapD
MATYITLDKIIANTRPEANIRDPEEERKAKEKAIKDKIEQEYCLNPKILDKLENEKKEIGNLIYELEKKRNALIRQLNTSGVDKESIDREINRLERQIESLKLASTFIENAKHDIMWAYVNLWNALAEKESLKI